MSLAFSHMRKNVFYHNAYVRWFRCIALFCYDLFWKQYLCNQLFQYFVEFKTHSDFLLHFVNKDNILCVVSLLTNHLHFYELVTELFKITTHLITWNHNVCHISFNNTQEENQNMLFLSELLQFNTCKNYDHDFEKVQHQRKYLCLMFTNIKCCSNVEVTSIRLEKLRTHEERSRTLTIGLSFSMRSFRVL